jgi:hypothetical protein
MDAPQAENTARNMNSSDTLQKWRLAFQGLMYYGSLTPIVEQPDEQLAILLNSMVMIQGGNNYPLSRPLPDADQTYGCLIYATKIPLVVEVLILLSAIFLVAAFLAFVVCWLNVLKQPKSQKAATKTYHMAWFHGLHLLLPEIIWTRQDVWIMKRYHRFLQQILNIGWLDFLEQRAARML